MSQDCRGSHGDARKRGHRLTRRRDDADGPMDWDLPRKACGAARRAAFLAAGVPVLDEPEAGVFELLPAGQGGPSRSRIPAGILRHDNEEHDA